jgi:hypothetical protein
VKKDLFPQTKDERFLLEVAQLASIQGNVLDWVQWQDVANRLRYGTKSSQNIVQILSRTYLLQKKQDLVRLTSNAFRHYGDQFCRVLKIDPPLFETED